MDRKKGRIIKGKAYLAPAGTPMPATYDGEGRPVSIDENGVTRWEHLGIAAVQTKEEEDG